MNLMERVEMVVDKINRLKDRHNRDTSLMGIINYLVEGEFDKHKVFSTIDHYTINDNDFDVNVIVEMIRRYCLKKCVEEDNILKKIDN